jgi:outer membrane protein OmpA-like peptidoglycan-associated protein
VFSDQVRFEPRTANIVPATEPALEALRLFLDKDKSITKIRIEGHTDPPNTPDMMGLSKARSKKVAEWLVNHGIDPGRIIPVGCGGARPVLNKGKVDEARSRRTEAHVVEEKGKPVGAGPVPADCAVD